MKKRPGGGLTQTFALRDLQEIYEGGAYLPMIVQGGLPRGCGRGPRPLPLIGATAALLRRSDIEIIRRKGRPLWYDKPICAEIGSARGLIRASVQRETLGLTGKGTTAALVDSGVGSHPDLDGAIRTFVDFVGGRSDPYDDYGHGTHLAGVIAGRGRAGSRFQGLAPDAGLVVLKVLNHEGVGRESTIIEGLEWCLRHRREFGISVVNLSLGGTVEGPWTEDPLCQAVEAVWREGLAVVTTAGNEGGRGRHSVRSPGVSPSVITVGAVSRRLRVAAFSSRGPTGDGIAKPDVVAPGTSIIAPRAAGSYLDDRYPQNRCGHLYFRQSGSSVATAMVSGALLLGFQQRPAASPDSMKAWLQAGCRDLGYDAGAQGSGLLNVSRFLEIAAGAAEPQEKPLLNPPCGHRTHAVWVLQNKLNLLGYTYVGPASGELDASTRRALTALKQRQIDVGSVYAATNLGASLALGERPLSVGHEGADVEELQERLRQAGYVSTDPLGTFGASTREALLAFQRDGHIPACGTADRHTFWRLGRRSPARHSLPKVW